MSKKKMPENWVETTIEDSVLILDNKRKPVSAKERSLRPGDVPYYGATGVAGNIDNYIFNEELVLLGEDGAPFFDKKKNVAFIINGKSWVNNHAHVLKAKDFVCSNKFLLHFLNQFEYKGYVGGTTRHKLNQTNLKAIPFPLPPLAEQERIVAKLDTLFSHLDAVKTRMEKIPTLLKNFRQAVLTQAVTGKLTEEWRVSKELESGSEWRNNIIKERRNLALPKRTPGLEYEDVIGGVKLPDNWTYGFLQNFGEFTRGKSKHRPRNDKRLFGGPYPFIQTGEVSRSNGLISDFTNTYSDFGLSQSRLFPKGTLCITIAANIAETGILNFDSCFPDSVVGYLPYKDLYTAKFAMFYLRVIQKDLEHFAPATAQKNINLGILFKIPFPVPPKIEQTEIVRRVESLFAKADAIESSYQALKQKIDSLPQALLAKAFRGELVDQLPTDGHAKDLLAKIAELK